jgi:hypothetical protein
MGCVSVSVSRPVLRAPVGEKEVCRKQVDKINRFIKNAFS